jgi:hypothetical protein
VLDCGAGQYACFADGARFDGQFIGESSDRTYLTDSHGKRVVSLPKSEVARLYVGDAAHDRTLDCPQPAPAD